MAFSSAHARGLSISVAALDVRRWRAGPASSTSRVPHRPAGTGHGLVQHGIPSRILPACTWATAFGRAWSRVSRADRRARSRASSARNQSSAGSASQPGPPPPPTPARPTSALLMSLCPQNQPGRVWLPGSCDRSPRRRRPFPPSAGRQLGEPPDCGGRLGRLVSTSNAAMASAAAVTCRPHPPHPSQQTYRRATRRLPKGQVRSSSARLEVSRRVVRRALVMFVPAARCRSH